MTFTANRIALFPSKFEEAASSADAKLQIQVSACRRRRVSSTQSSNKARSTRKMTAWFDNKTLSSFSELLTASVCLSCSRSCLNKSPLVFRLSS